MSGARDLAARLTPPATSTDLEAAYPRMVKYTLLLAAEDADAIDQLLLRIRRAEGRRLTKSQLIRCLLRFVVADASLLNQVFECVPQAERP